MAKPRSTPTTKAKVETVGFAQIYKKRRQLLVRAIRFKTWYYYTLVGANNETLCTSENFTQKHNVVEVLKKYFPTFEVQDKTGE